MPDMPRPRKPYIQREVTRHGKTVWYFRRGTGKRIRLPGVFGSKEFNAAYEACLSGRATEPVASAPRTSLRWLVDQYYESGRYKNYAENTRRNQRLMLESVCKTGGQLEFARISSQSIREGMVRREGTPRMAATYVSVMRALFAFAVDSGWISVNPVVDEIKARKASSDGYHTWTLEEVEQYQARHPVGTQARLALDILLYTGLRRGDAIKLGRQHVKNQTIAIRAGKNGAEITIPLLPPLAASIAATKTGDLVFLQNSKGRPHTSNHFGYWFRDRCDEAHLPKECTAHGLRKAGATIAAENGATPFELMAMYGWTSPSVAEIYTRKANRVKLAERAANKLSPHQPKGSGDDAPEALENKGGRNGH